MTAVALVLAGLAILLGAWSYLVYPAMIGALSRRASAAPPAQVAAPRSIEIVLSAADEEDVIVARVRNLLEQEAPLERRISIGCDGCVDRTAERARAALGGGGGVVEFEERRGKAAVVNDLVAGSSADLIAFTDANTLFDTGAVASLVRPFSDPEVGAVCGRLLLEAPSRAGVETYFWDRETRLKEAEGRLGVCLGANGAIYAARRAWIEPLPAGAVLDDFLIPARIARLGRKVVFAGDAVAREEAGGNTAVEVVRRFRIGNGAAAILKEETWLFDLRRHGLLSLAFLSRKAARWIAPVLALAAPLAALGSAPLRPAAIVLLSIAAALLLSAAARPRLPGIAGRFYDFCVLNIALAAGLVVGLAGYRRPAWRRTR